MDALGLTPTAIGDNTAILVMIYPPGPDLGRRFVLEHGVNIVGRLGQMQVQIDSDSVSRRHARITHVQEGWVLEDLGSTNGSFVNDERVTRRVLCNGDQLRFGAALAKFLSGNDIEAAYHEAIYRMSILDALTGAHNKRHLIESLERELAAAARHELSLALVMLDIDHFKQVNDQHGHLAGDQILKELGCRVRPRIRREDLFARYGGEEFACILTQTSSEGALAFAESLRGIVSAQPFSHDTGEVSLTISLGVALYHGGRGQRMRPDELIRAADEKLYAAKHGGRDRVAI
jgi:diguanylate cyclase (GGDEF)-like protein